MRYLLTALLFLHSGWIWGQSGIQLPVVIPPSPEVAQLAKANGMSAGLHTGSAGVSLPIYSFTVNKTTVPVSLSYNSNGIRVDDIPSRAGLGWNLLAGGVVNRTIRDEPDGDVAFKNPPNLYNKDTALYNYITNSAPTYDTEYDEYAYSFSGMSGKFFLDANGNGYCIPHNNLKVKVNGHNTSSKWVEITTPEGTRYQFGLTVREKTRTINVSGGSGTVNKTAAYETGWFLEKIITPEGGTVFFNYTAAYIKTHQGRHHTEIKPVVNSNSSCTYSEQYGTNYMEYDTYYLNNINTTGIHVNFTYEARPDNSGDTRLAYINVTASGAVTVNKWFKFTYETPSTNNSSLNKRYFLTKFSTMEAGTGTGYDLGSGNWLTHTFQYLDKDNMPDRLTYGQDWWGYNNGVTNNGTRFAPYIAGIANAVVNGAYGANRDPGSLADMQKGMLSKVIYPTGGEQEFVFEPHTYLKYNITPTYDNASCNGSGLNTSDPWVHTSQTFTANADQNGEIDLSCYKSPAFPDAPSGEGDRIYELKVKKSATGEVVFYRRFYNYTTESGLVPLQNGVTYYLELTIKGEVNAGSASIKFNPGTAESYENKIAGGVRVKQINSFDPVSGTRSARYFTYAALSDLNKSSGVGLVSPMMHVPYQTAYTTGSGLNITTHVCDNYMVSSSGISPAFNFSGSPYAYTHVIESDDPSFVNGFTEHFFNTYVAASPYNVIMGNTPLSTPANITTEDNGQEFKTRYYKRSGTANVLLREVQHYYGRGNITNLKTSTIVRQRYTYLPTYNPPSDLQFNGFDLVQYNHVSGWITLDSTVTLEYDQNGSNVLKNKMVYTYADNTHLQVTKAEQTQSNGLQKVTEYKYPNDLKSGGTPNVYNEMINRHMITPVVEEKLSTGSPLVQQLKTNYNYQYFNGTALIAPAGIQQAYYNAAVQNRVLFNKYSSTGEILEQQKYLDAVHAYIWGYAPEVPIAEAVNATTAEIAYTSFEAGTTGGGWTVPSANRDASAVTGKVSYNLASGGITRSVSSGTIYTVSYWKTGSALSISGTVSLTTGRSWGSWTYYQHRITGVSLVTLTGSGLIDEIRLYPEKAGMTTFTYDPLTGITSTCDNNNYITRFEYDGFNRLLHVRDLDQNILKKYQYTYGEAVANCTNTTPNWQVTGVIRCVKNSNNNNTGEQQREEKDMNNCSATYLQQRWVSIGYNSTACPTVPNCTGADKRVIENQCVTGTKVITSSYFSGGVQYCTYHYEWPDGYWSPNYQSTGTDCVTIE